MKNTGLNNQSLTHITLMIAINRSQDSNLSSTNQYLHLYNRPLLMKSSHWIHLRFLVLSPKQASCALTFLLLTCPGRSKLTWIVPASANLWLVSSDCATDQNNFCGSRHFAWTTLTKSPEHEALLRTAWTKMKLYLKSTPHPPPLGRR